MHTKTIVEGAVLVVAVITAIVMLPDFIRYMKIRSM
jgi:uncharacterized protein DUF6893